MTTKDVLRPIDLNRVSSETEYIPDPSDSPAIKRARYCDGPINDQWSLSRNGVLLDDVYDYGVKLLESGSEGDKEEKEVLNQTDTCPSEGDLAHANINVCDSPSTPNWPTNKDWDEFIIKKTEYDEPPVLPKYFSCLSDEIVLQIFHFLPKSQLPTAAMVCQQWRRLAADDSLWARLDASGRCLRPGALGHILSRQVVILRLASATMSVPAVLPNSCRAATSTFRARLMYLDLSMAHVPSADVLVDLFSLCRALKKVSLEQVNGMDDEVMLALSHSRDLQVLNLAMAVGITETGMRYLLKNCQKLRELNIAWTNLSSKCIKYICSHLPESLDRLNFSGCRKLIHDINICALVESCPGLRELDLSDCNALTTIAVSHIMKLRDLNFLAASRCYAIPPRAFLQLRDLPELVYLDVHGTYISQEDINLIQDGLGERVNLNKFKFSSVARPTTGARRSSIWNLRVRD